MESKELPQSSFLKEALEKLTTVRAKDKLDVIKTYNEWTNYDESMSVLSYSGHKQTAVGVVEHLSGKRDVTILDVGAGTGAVAVELRKLGFTNIDGLDPSEGMLKLAKEQHLYQKCFIAPFTDKVECIETSSYDVLVCSGGLSYIQSNALPEMIRCVKTGGLVVLVFNERILTKFPHRMSRIEELQAEGKWHCLENINFPGFFYKENGVRCVLRITKST